VETQMGRRREVRARRLVLKREVTSFCRATYESQNVVINWFACSIW
jgi:hypothetical protein